jgi:hypothetical protein
VTETASLAGSLFSSVADPSLATVLACQKRGGVEGTARCATRGKKQNVLILLRAYPKTRDTMKAKTSQRKDRQMDNQLNEHSWTVIKAQENDMRIERQGDKYRLFVPAWRNVPEETILDHAEFVDITRYLMGVEAETIRLLKEAGDPGVHDL